MESRWYLCPCGVKLIKQPAVCVCAQINLLHYSLVLQYLGLTAIDLFFLKPIKFNIQIASLPRSFPSLNDECASFIWSAHHFHWSLFSHNSALFLCSLAKKEAQGYLSLNHSTSFLLLLGCGSPNGRGKCAGAFKGKWVCSSVFPSCSSLKESLCETGPCGWAQQSAQVVQYSWKGYQDLFVFWTKQ